MVKSIESIHQLERNSALSTEKIMSPAGTTMSNTRTALISLTNKGALSVEHVLAEKMHKSRYQCKMNLQICALQSQQSNHQDALIYGKKAAKICYNLIKNS